MEGWSDGGMEGRSDGGKEGRNIREITFKVYTLLLSTLPINDFSRLQQLML